MARGKGGLQLRITINTFGTLGDIQPYIAFGKGLEEAGHDVCILTHQIFEAFVREHGLEVHPMALNPREVLVEKAFAEFGNNLFRFMPWLKGQYKVYLKELFRSTDEAAEGADLLLNSLFSFAGYHVAQKRGIPVFGAYLQMVTPTRAFHSMNAQPPPKWLPFKGAYNYLSMKLGSQFFFNLLKSLVNECREDVLGLPPLGSGYYWRADTDDTIPFLYGYSPSVLPKPPDWGENIRVAGYWFLDQAEGYNPPLELVDFLESGSPPVYVGFGSMVEHEEKEITRLIVEAVGQADCRTILLGGWSELGGGELPDNILRIDYAPHEWLFPKMAAVVHHGGAGTTAAGFRAGVPTVVVPFFGDQFFWGWRTAELGVGPDAISRKKLTAERLANAIKAAVSDGSMRQRAAALGEKISTEDGVGRAVEFIEEYVMGNKT
jgi:UDP:flavonoid glycosyltransferase YjiC (YdhE family)